MDLEEKIQKLEKDIEALKKRNARVEDEKAWETSVFRVFTITLITYIIATAVMWTINVPQPYLGALIPTIGYYLSTQSIPIIKRWWIEKKHQVEGKK